MLLNEFQWVCILTWTGFGESKFFSQAFLRAEFTSTFIRGFYNSIFIAYWTEGVVVQIS